MPVVLCHEAYGVCGSSSLRHAALILDSYASPEAMPRYSCVKLVKEIRYFELNCNHHIGGNLWRPKPIGKVPVSELVAFFDGEKKGGRAAVDVLFLTILECLYLSYVRIRKYAYIYYLV